MIIRETIYAALWALASRSASFATASRRLRHWTDVGAAEQPALFMAEKGALAKQGEYGLPVTYLLSADFYIYAHSADPYLAPASILNPLIDALEKALSPNPATGTLDLGLPTMVQRVYISGKIETDEGVLGDQAVAIIPVEILAVN